MEEKRLKLYFENMVTTVTTLMILSLVGFVVYSISSRSNINYWAIPTAIPIVPFTNIFGNLEGNTEGSFQIHQNLK